jgi:hypothetical protein
VASSRKVVMQTTKQQRKFITDKREEMYGRWRLRYCGTPLHTSLASVAPYRIWGRLSQTRAYEPTTLSVDAVKAYSCRSDYWFLSFGEVRQLWTCRYCHMSSDRLVALLIKRQEVSSHVSIAVIGRCADISPQYQNSIESGEEGVKPKRR